MYLLVIVAAAALFLSIFPSTDQRSEIIDLSAVAEQVKQGKVESITVSEDDLRIRLHSGEVVTSRKQSGQSLPEALLGLGVTPEQLRSFAYIVEPPSQAGNWFALVGSLLPLIFVGALFFFLMRQAQGSNSQAMSFGKSKARMLTGDKPTVTFDDVAGCEEAKQELAEVVEFLKEPQKFASLGARIPKGV
ncbi:MAG: cell division protein FtsH, partial [Chloroflexi bacterium]|nr:cell division protein FtsH [Chloroflexota bacterium]